MHSLRSTRILVAAGGLACAMAACTGRPGSGSGSTTATNTATALAAVARTGLRGRVGDTIAFPARIVAVGYGPSRATFETTNPGYVTLISVDEARIEALMPLADEGPRIQMAGSHTTGLNANSARRFIPGDGTGGDARVAEVQAYNRCMRSAAQYDRNRQEASRKIVGRDSAGRPIYGPPDPAVVEDRRAEGRCQMASPPNREIDASAQPARANRYLLLYVSDTPVEHKSILELTVNETDPRMMTIAIGRKLFDGRGALWSGHYRPW